MNDNQNKPLVLILCTGNSCRSQMAEGLLRHYADDILNVQSAGSNPSGVVHRKAIAVMREIGVDISSHRSKHANEFLEQEVETAITVCGYADQTCPHYPGLVNRHHWPFEDPSHIVGTEDMILKCFRQTRDDIARVFGAYASGRRDQIKASKCIS